MNGPGEHVRDYLLKTGTEAAYPAGNSTNAFANHADLIIPGAGSIQGGLSIRTTAFKGWKDIARGDQLSTGLCLIFYENQP